VSNTEHLSITISPRVRQMSARRRDFGHDNVDASRSFLVARYPAASEREVLQAIALASK
jgi:hypothetical protein